MRPHAKPSDHKRAADARRQLRNRTVWIPGFPHDGRWQPFGAEQGDGPAVEVGPEAIRRAERARVDTPEDLVARVAEPAWFAGLDHLIQAAKVGNLTGSAWDRFRPQVRALAAGLPPGLGPMSAAVSWWRLTHPAEATADVKALLAHPQAFTELLGRRGLIAAMRVLRNHREAPFDEALRWIADPRSWIAPAGEIVGNNLAARTSNVSQIGSAGVWWARLVQAPTFPVGWLAALAPHNAVREAWLAERAGYVEDLQKIAARILPKAHEAVPASLPLPRFVDNGVVFDDPPGFARALAQIPDDARLGRLRFVQALVKTGWPQAPRTALQALRAPFPWDELVDHLDDWRVKELLFESTEAHAVAAVLRRPVTPAGIEQASDAVWVAGKRAAELLGALGPEAKVGGKAHRFALAATAHEPHQLGPLLRALPEDWPLAASATLQSASLTALIGWFEDHLAQRLERLAASGELAGQALLTAPPDRDLAGEDWWQALPLGLQEPARAVARVDEAGRDTVLRALHPAIVDPETVRSQIAWIDGAVARGEANEGLLKRRQTLALRLSRPVQVSPRRAAHLAADLLRIARDRRLARWEAHAAAVVEPIVRERLGVTGDLRPFFDPRYRRVIGAASALNKRFRALLAQVFQARAGPPPWDLPSLPGNQRTAARLASQGVDLGPWLSRALVTEARLPDEGRVRLQLEADPLELLRMGEHFGTCLSPGSVNWFSAVANAVDLHRQVLYVRDVDATVVARVLVCLTDKGGMLSFELYCHRHADVIEPAVTAHLQALAAAMNTVVVPNGTVPLGVAPRWYDDGAVDRAGACPALIQGSEFREALGSIDPSAVAERMREALAPAPLPIAVGWVLGLPEVWSRVDLLLALRPVVEQLHVHDPTRVELYRHLEKAGQGDQVVGWVRAHAPGVLTRRWRDPAIDWIFDVALREFPGKLLGWAKDLSPCAHCPWDMDGNAAFHAARAHRRLHRGVEARRLAALSLGSDRHSGLDGRFVEEAKALASDPA